jgi:hypothetical protein
MELRKSPPLESGGIPARNRNKRTHMAEFVGKSSLDPGEFPLSGSKEILAGNMELRKFLPLEGGRIPARNGNKRTWMAKFVGKSSLDPGEFLPSESKEIQMAECIGKSSLNPGEFLPLGSLKKSPLSGSKEILAGNTGLRKFLPLESGKISVRNGRESEDTDGRIHRKLKLELRKFLSVTWRRENSCQNQEQADTDSRVCQEVKSGSGRAPAI